VSGSRAIEGPYFDELEVGQVFADAPAYTLSAGRAASHQSIVGDRLRMPLDDTLAAAVTGRSPLAHPAFVWDVAIGQSTAATQHVRANLFYRNLILQRLPSIDDTLRTVTTVVGLKENARREGRTAAGLAALRMVTIDQDDRPVLDFYRCAMLPLRHHDETGHADDLAEVTSPPANLLQSVAGWDLSAWRERVSTTTALASGDELVVIGADVVSSAPELARLTLNVARVHHEATAAGGRRLVYGGHTIGLALSQAARALPDLVTVLGWHGCDHVGPVHEDDALTSRITVEAIESGDNGRVVHLRSRVRTGEELVLDWRYVVLLA